MKGVFWNSNGIVILYYKEILQCKPLKKCNSICGQ
jgi:hypothetical protein